MTPSPPSTPVRKRLSRDQRRDILLMRSLKYTYAQISSHLGVTERAVQYTCEKGEATPQHKKTGRPPKLSTQEVDTLIEFVISSRKTRRMTYLQLAESLWPDGEVGAESVKHALRKRGYNRRVALRKPPLSQKNIDARLEWAREHLYWTEQQWQQILWSDESWIKPGTHRKVFITRRPGEELDPTCLVERIQRSPGWMFWGCFHSNIKGPSIFWEKDWGSINQQTYCDHTVPVVHGWIRMNSGLQFMQDNAPGHAAAATRAEFAERDIPVILWPAFSPDLNPIETVWNKMKDWLDIHYPSKFATYDQLRQQVKEAWDQVVTPDLLKGLLDTMHQRCQDVIDARGGHTKW